MKKTLLFLGILCLFFRPTDSNGQTGWQWGRTKASTSNTTSDEMIGATVVDNSGNLFVAANLGDNTISLGSITITNPLPGGLMLVTKTDSSGNFLWAQGIMAPFAPGNTTLSIAVDTSGDLYFLGRYASDSCIAGPFTLYNPLEHVMYFLVKYDRNGAPIWAENVADVGIPSTSLGVPSDPGAISVDKYNFAYIQALFNGKKTVVGPDTLINSDTSGTTFDVFLARVDPAGTVAWATRYGGTGSEYCGNVTNTWCAPMTTNSNGQFIIVGQTNSDTLRLGSFTFVIPSDGIVGVRACYLAAEDTSGSTIWAKNLGAHVYINGMTTDQDRNIYIAGCVDSVVVMGRDTIPWTNDPEMIVAKFKANGDLEWVKYAANLALGQVGYAIAADLCGRLWIIGSLGGNGKMDFGGHVLSADTLSDDAAFVAEYDTSGNYDTSMALPSLGDDYAGIATDNRGSFYVSGDYAFTSHYGSMVFGKDTFAYHLGNEAFILARYRYDSAKCPDIENAVVTIPDAQTDFNLYPNPAINELMIAGAQPIYNVSISNLLGQNLITQSYDYGLEKAQVYVSRLSPGIYFIKINNLEVRRFLKE